MSNKQNSKKNKNNIDDSDIFNNVNDNISLLVSYANQLNKKNDDDFKDTEGKLNNYVNMMQNVIENYYNFCTEKL